MRRIEFLRYIFVATVVMTLPSFVSATARADDDRVDYNRDIRPILSDNCYKCHGPDANQRQTEMRLDTERGAFQELESGGFAIVRGKSAGSGLYRRITSINADEKMPPPDSGKNLTKKQIELLRKWIDQGAEWRGHWAFIKPQRPALPKVKNGKFVRNAIDNFVLARLQEFGLKPSLQARKESLIRRVTFDLTGLPPTLAEVDAFLADKSANAYEKVVDRLLKSPRYGEHMARFWLDAARYGDTHGLHLDNERSIWPYREWVIDAFNTNLPFDRFTVEQMAGDLLPNPSIQQLVATGFNRCNVTTSEGGAIADEYRFKYGVDRVETTATVWLGLTMGCAVCHEHKFDPISQPDFYKFFAYFNSLTEKAMDGNALLPPPTIKVARPEQEQQLKRFRQQVAKIEQQIKAEVAKVKYVDPKSESAAKPRGPQEVVWIDDALPSGAKPTSSGGGPKGWQFVSKPKHPVFSGTKASTRKSKGLGQHFFTGANPGLRVGEGDKLFAYVYLDLLDPPKEIMLQFNDGTWEHRAIWGENLIEWGQSGTVSRRPMGKLPDAGEWVRLEIEAAQVGLKPGAVINGWAFTQFDGTVYWDKAGIVTKTPQDGSQFESLLAWEQLQRSLKKSSLPKPIQDAVKLQPGKRTGVQQKQVRDYFIEHAYSKSRPVFAGLHKQIADVKNKIAQVEKSAPSTLIMRDMPTPRKTYVLKRGQYDQPDKTQEVKPGVPQSIGPPLPKDAPPNRLALARWLVDPAHPLTARVTVNRFWLQYFGTGIVKTAEDFGSQGEWPSHPKLLDWLATEFIESGWDVKKLQKLIVMSATYRQSSKFRTDGFEKDRENRLLWHGPRFRLDAEMLRDNALAVSGLLNEKIGGKSVRPYQPGGLWKAVGYSGSNTVKFVQDQGDKLYRRSLYTFWKRTAAPPSMLTFDAPSRESCTVRRARTNTPLQALLLMNDIQFVEASRKLAERMMTEGGLTPETRIAFAFRSATARRPKAGEKAVLLEVYKQHLSEFQGDKQAALKLLGVGEAKRNEKLDVSELAAFTMVANLILNLDETVTKS